MCHPPRLCVAILTTYVTLATGLSDGTGSLNLQYLPHQRPPQQLDQHMRPSQLEDLLAPYNDPDIGSPDYMRRAEPETPSQQTEDSEEQAMTLLAGKLQGTENRGPHLSQLNEGSPDHQRRDVLEDGDLVELMRVMSQESEPDLKNRLPRETYDIRNPEYPIEIGENIDEEGMLLVNCRSGRLDWPPCTLFNNAGTGPLPMPQESAQHEKEYVEESEDSGEKQGNAEVPTSVESDQDVGRRRKRETEMPKVNEISRTARQAGKETFVSQSNVLPNKVRKGFSAWGGKRVPPFESWGGKRAPDFHSWGGKRAQDGLKTLKKQPSAWEGKRMPAFHSWGGKRAPSFNSWGGKRVPSFNSWGGKRAPAFNSWGGKRAPAFNSWGGKRAPAFTSWGGKRAPFNSWGGKRAPSFNSWGGKRAPAFTSWGGKRAAFNSWGGKRAPSFNSWGGKRASFNSWGGKRGNEDGYVVDNEDVLGKPLINPTGINELENELANGVGLLHSPWSAKWALHTPQFNKVDAAEAAAKNNPPGK